MLKLERLRNNHYGSTIWVLGSGPSLNFLSADFFADKITVSTNYSADSLGFVSDYAFSHYHHVSWDLLDKSKVVVTLAKDTVTQQDWLKPDVENLVLIEQLNYNPPGSNWNPLTSHNPGNETLAYGSSSLHGSMHLAAWLGAAHIVLVGADCGTLDGEHRIDTYPVKNGHTPWELYDQHHKLMKTFLEENYGVTVYSLNPFINFNLEGHAFQGV